MSTKLIAKKYAKALVDVGEETPQGSEQFRSGLKRACELFAIPQAAKILKSPIMPASLKRDLLLYALANDGSAKQLTVFVDLLIAAKRVDLLPEIVELYEEIVAEAKGQQHGVLTSAVPVGASEKTELERKLTALFTKHVVLENRVDAGLLGGFTIRIGNTVIDQSVTSKIRALTLGLQLS